MTPSAATSCDEILDELVSSSNDPRISGDALRCIERTDTLGRALLVGVVHDHPASEFRARQIVTALSPDLFAVELPPLAVPLFRQYARSSEIPPPLGGEMSTAIQAADGAVFGIDGPNSHYLHRVMRTIRSTSNFGTIERSLLADVMRTSLHAIATRLGAMIGSLGMRPPVLYDEISYDTSSFESPATQADHETNHIETRVAFLNAIIQPPEIAVIDDLREAAMADRLTELRRRGDVVGVVGMEHLDPLMQLLNRTESTSGGAR